MLKDSFWRAYGLLVAVTIAVAAGISLLIHPSVAGQSCPRSMAWTAIRPDTTDGFGSACYDHAHSFTGDVTEIVVAVLFLGAIAIGVPMSRRKREAGV